MNVSLFIVCGASDEFRLPFINIPLTDNMLVSITPSGFFNFIYKYRHKKETVN